MKRKEATFQEFKEFTRAVVRGERAVDPNEPKIWIERVESGEAADTRVAFASLEAGAKLLSAKNRVLLRTIAENKPQSVSELAAMTGRAEQMCCAPSTSWRPPGSCGSTGAKAVPGARCLPPARFISRSILSGLSAQHTGRPRRAGVFP